MPVSAAERWAQARTFHHSRYPVSRLVAERSESVSVCLPARECAGTVGHIVATLAGLRDAGVIDEVVVVDAASRDGTAAVAAEAGAIVYQQDELMTDLGVVRGKGDAMWRVLSMLRSDLVCFLDADLDGFDAHFASGLLGPLICDPGVSFVKAFYRRPFGAGWALVGDAGCHKDPYLALGMRDALRDAELLSDAAHEGLSESQPVDAALAGYEAARNAASKADYQQNIQAARLLPPPEETRSLLAALRGHEEDTRQFFLVRQGLLPAERFFNPLNLQRIMAG